MTIRATFSRKPAVVLLAGLLLLLPATGDACRMYAAIGANLPDGMLYDHLRGDDTDFPYALYYLAPQNDDGWGIGYYPQFGGLPTIARGEPMAQNDPAYMATVVAIDTPPEPQITLAHVRKGTSGIETLDDCRGRVVGTLKQSLAFFTLEEAGVSDIRTYEDEINAYADLENGRLDAALFDDPIAMYYAGFNPNIEFVGRPIGKMEYGIAVRKGDDELLARVNEAVASLRDSGELRRIYERWNLWTPVMAEMFRDHSPQKTDAVMFRAWTEHQKPVLTWEKRLNRYAGFLPVFAKGALVTMEVSFVAMLLAITLGLFLAMVRIFAPKPLSWLAVAYIELIRGTPVLIQLFFIFYGLPNIGIRLSPFVAGVLGLGLNYAAYEAENYRAGLLAIPRHQMEGAMALSMTRFQALRHVVLPQAIRVALPPVTNDFISLLKDSSLVSVITMVDLTKAYGQVATTYYDYFGTGLMVAAIYFLLGFPFVRLARWAEKRMAVAIHGRVGDADMPHSRKPASY